MKLVVCCEAFLPADQEGGPPFSTANLCRGLASAGADVHVITTDRNGRRRLDVVTNRWIPRDGFRVWYGRTLPSPYYHAPSARHALDSVGRIDGLISSGTLWTHLGRLAWQTSQRRQVPNVVFPRGLLAPWALAIKPWRKRIYWSLAARRILRDAAAVVVLSESERDAVRSLGIDGRFEVIPNSVCVDDFAHPEPRSSLDEWLPAVRGRPFVLFMGRIHERKGIKVLIEAMREPVIAERDFRLVIAGHVEESYRSTWETMVSSAGSRVVLAGPVSGARKTALLGHAAAFVLPSHGEGQPVAALEALASGCPTVLTARCHLTEATEAGAGIEVERMPSAIATALARLLPDDALRRGMSERGRALARTRFDTRVIGQQILMLCRDMARRHSLPTQTRI